MSQTRRLAAILAADVARYSRLMGLDDEGTLERLKALRSAPSKLASLTDAQRGRRQDRLYGQGAQTPMAYASATARRAPMVRAAQHCDIS
jgi:adenylate cyclase